MTGRRAAAAVGHPGVDVAAVLQAHLARVDEHLRRAVDDAHALERIADQATASEVVGRARAYATLSRAAWTEALGARAQLEALYQDLVGEASPGHQASTHIKADHALPANPVGLADRHPHVAAFLAEHAADGRGEADRTRPASARDDAAHPTTPRTTTDHDLDADIELDR